MIPADDPKIQYSGRIDFSNPKAPRFDWPGISLTVRFKSPFIGFFLEDGNNNFEVQVDGKPVTVWETKPDQDCYVVKDLSKEEHVIRVVKRTEALFGAASFKGLLLDAKGILLEPPAKPSRKIEFVGDSIVCGYGNEAATLKCATLRPYENVDKAFGADTARDLVAEAVFVAYSGKGVVRNYGDKNRESADPFPPLFNRTLCHNPGSLWNFSGWIPDAVVIHLGSNDFSSEPQADPRNYIKKFVQFVKTIRKSYPQAGLFCICPTGWPNFSPHVEAVVKNLNSAGDERVYYVGYPNAPEADLGCDYHPNVKAHRAIADILTPTLRQKMGW